jgi:CRP-like cAMP-binding protein
VASPDVTAPGSGARTGVSGRWISQSSAQRNLGLLKPADISELRKIGTERSVLPGTVVAAAGSRATHVQVITDGELELQTRVATGRVTMAVVRRGGVIADIPMLLDAPMPFDAVASRDTSLVRLSQDRWMKLLTSRPALCVRWMTSIARRLDDDRRRLVVVTTRPLVSQVAYVLLDLAEEQVNGESLVRLSHATIAHLLGARRQSVTRVIAELRSCGYIATRYGMTVLLDEQGLTRVMGTDPLP